MLQIRSNFFKKDRALSSSGFGAMHPKNIIGPIVRRRRMAMALSQDALAARCQRMGWALSRATLSKIEARLRRVSDGEVALLAHALDCSTAVFFPPLTSPRDFAAVLAIARHSED